MEPKLGGTLPPYGKFHTFLKFFFEPFPYLGSHCIDPLFGQKSVMQQGNFV